MNFQQLTMTRLRLAHIGDGYNGLAVSSCLENHYMPVGLWAYTIGFPVDVQGCSVPISRGSPPTVILDE
jgi:hypothetical protein